MNDILYSRIEGEGKPLVILHGYLGMSDNWKTLGTKYAEEGFQVHMIDLRNHGRSFHSDIFNYDVMTDDVVAYCAYHNISNINIIGHSMGGKVAMKLAVKHPQLVSKLIVADISPKSYRPHHHDIMTALNAVDFSIHTTRNDIQKVIEHYVNDPGIVQFLMKNVHRITNDTLGFRFNLNAFNKDDQAIGQPLQESDLYVGDVLFLKGELSNYIKAGDEELIKKHFPEAKIETISGAGHWLHAENPTEFFDKSIVFLK